MHHACYRGAQGGWPATAIGGASTTCSCGSPVGVRAHPEEAGSSESHGGSMGASPGLQPGLGGHLPHALGALGGGCSATGV